MGLIRTCGRVATEFEDTATTASPFCSGKQEAFSILLHVFNEWAVIAEEHNLRHQILTTHLK